MSQIGAHSQPHLVRKMHSHLDIFSSHKNHGIQESRTLSHLSLKENLNLYASSPKERTTQEHGHNKGINQLI